MSEKCESELPKSETVGMKFAFPVDGNKWRIKPATVTFSCGFLDGLEVEGEDISHSFGQYGMSVTFTYLASPLPKEGKGIGDVYGVTYNDGQMMTNVLVAEGTEIVQ